MEGHCGVVSAVAQQCLEEDLFTISKNQEAVFSEIKQKLGQGSVLDIRGLRRHCSRCRDDLEEAYEKGDWPADQAEDRKERMKIMQIMEFICDEIIAMQRVSKASKHEDVIVGRGLAGILHERDLVPALYQEDRLVVESGFGLTDHNVRSRKIDTMHQLCLEGNSKPVGMTA
ncbi:hypothetical protein BGZ70_001292 [Mortierella alpina]|uniref:Uncharacterized protein n=1 Tax=Mortierella alpina TaxID=64518 RepID=A0A9P6LXR0_MORAP|nr:hypothetical protein BGZ70_001292 [Mortierella alpina]